MDSEKLNACHIDNEPCSPPDSKEKTVGSERILKSEKLYPGILEDGLVYSCAGPRVDPE